MAITHNNINLSENTILIEKTLTRDEKNKVILGSTTKTIAGKRTIFLNTKATNILKASINDNLPNTYNLLFFDDDKDFTPLTKFQAYSLKNNFINKYTQNTDVLLNSLSIFKNEFASAKLSELTQGINTVNLQGGVKYSSRYLDNICYVVLNELVNNNITIKTCKHCGRYFIPVNRQAEVYCDLTPITK